MEKKSMILAIAGICAVVFLGISILLHGFGMTGYGMGMRGAAPYAVEHGGWGHHH